MTTSEGKQIKYTNLILATGGAPKKLPIEGKDLEGVVTLRHVWDTKTITSSVTKDSDVVIIGTSFIGMEVAMALKKLEPKSITLVGVDEIPFASILGKAVGTAIMENMKRQGIKFHMQASVKKLVPAGERLRASLRVETDVR